MKIDSLRFKNINSLKGEWTINFDQPPLTDAGVFAITGPNGSGKSSILDAITLGLYGETFKFDHPSAHVMTQQTDESYAEVVFTLDSKQFRSSWSAQKTDGKLIPPEMQISHLIGGESLIKGQPGKVRDFIAKLTGMDFRRFTRSIVLAQGDFAAFLNALDNERLDILEKIVGSDVFDGYQQNILNAAEHKKNTLKKLKQDLAAITLKSPTEIEAIEHDLIDFNNQLTEGKQERDALERQNASMRTIATIIEQIAETNQAIEQCQNQSKQISDKITAVESIKDFAVVKSGVETLAYKQQQSISGQDTLSDYRHELTQLQNTIGQLTTEDRQQPDLNKQSVTEQITNLGELKYQLEQLQSDSSNESELLVSLQQQLQTKELDLESVTAWLQAHQTDRVLLDTLPDIKGLKGNRDDIISTRKQTATVAKKMKNQVAVAKKIGAEINKLQKEIDKIQAVLQKQQSKLQSLLSAQPLGQVQDDLAELEERRSTYENLVTTASDLDKLLNPKRSRFLSFGASAKSRQTRQTDIALLTQKADLAAEYETLLEDQEQAIDDLTQLEKAVGWEARLQKQEAERKLLIAGEPCCLCGATQHPYVTDLLPVHDSQKALADKQKQVASYEKRAAQLVDKIKKVHALKQSTSKDNKSKIELESYWQELCTRLNKVSEDFTINDLKAAKKLLAEQNKIVSNYTSIINNYQTLQQKIEHQQTLLDQKTTALGVVTLTQAQSHLHKTTPQEQKTLELILASSLQENQGLTTKLTEQLNALGEKLPEKGKEDKLLEKLQLRQQTLRGHLNQQQFLQQELPSLAAKIESSQKKNQQLEQQLQVCKISLHSSEVASLHLAMVEKQKLIVEQEQTLVQHQKIIKAMEQQFKVTLDTIGISSIDEAQKRVEDEPQISIMRQQQLSLGEQAEQFKLTAETLQTELKTHQEQVLTTLTLEEIIHKQKAIDSQLSIANQEIKTAENILVQQNSVATLYQDLQEKIEQQTVLSQQCQVAVDKLASDSPAQIKRRVQKIMIDQLLTKSNQFLENISGRYCIHQRESDQGLALVIEDKSEGSILRLPQTLSGGESFVISLSLALGLSGMATGRQAVESLFLDEGFGTLDDETLYVVLSTLQNLHRSGKMVGVISHIKELKERIRTQIHLTKEKNGHSSLEVIS